MDSLRTRTAAASAALAFLLLLPAEALAAAANADRYGESTPLDLPEESTAKVADIGGGGGSLTRTFLGLAVVVAVIYGVAWVLRQVKTSREERTSGFGLSSEAVVALGPNRSVHLIRAGRELVLVGSAEQGVVPIRTYTEEEARRVGLLAPEGLPSGDIAGTATATAVRPRRADGKKTIGELLDDLRKRTAR